MRNQELNVQELENRLELSAMAEDPSITIEDLTIEL